MLQIPLPTMTFTENSITISNERLGIRLNFDTISALRKVSRKLPTDICIEVSALPFWQEKSYATLLFSFRRKHYEIPIEYDWTFWTEYEGDAGANVCWMKSEVPMNTSRLASTDEPVMHFQSTDFFEDELADNGLSLYNLKLVSLLSDIELPN